MAIFLDGSIYHATVEGGVLAQSPEDFFEAEIVENGISVSEITEEVSKLNTSQEILSA